MGEVLLTAEQVASRFDVVVSTVIHWCKRGWLPGATQIGKVRMWLIPEKALEGFKRPSPGPSRRVTHTRGDGEIVTNGFTRGGTNE